MLLVVYLVLSPYVSVVAVVAVAAALGLVLVAVIVAVTVAIAVAGVPERAVVAGGGAGLDLRLWRHQ